MKALKTTQILLAILLLASACGKARYEQRWGDPQPTVFNNNLTPKPVDRPMTQVVPRQTPITQTPQRPVVHQEPLVPAKQKQNQKQNPKVVVVKDTVMHPQCVTPVEGFNCYKSDWVQPDGNSQASLDVLVVLTTNHRGETDEQVSLLLNQLSRSVDAKVHLVRIFKGEFYTEDDASLSKSAVKNLFRADAGLAVVFVGQEHVPLLKEIVSLKSSATSRTNYSSIRQRATQSSIESVVIESVSELSAVAGKIKLKVDQPMLKTELAVVTNGAVDSKTVCVIADDLEVSSRYNKNSKRIEFTDVGRFNSKVEIYYCQNVRENLPSSKYVTMQIDKRCESLRTLFKR